MSEIVEDLESAREVETLRLFEMAEGGASTGGVGAGAAVVKEGKLFKRGEVMMLVVLLIMGMLRVALMLMAGLLMRMKAVKIDALAVMIASKSIYLLILIKRIDMNTIYL